MPATLPIFTPSAVTQNREMDSREIAIGEDGGDVFEDDAGLREINHVTDGSTERVRHCGRNVGSLGKCKTSKESLALKSCLVFLMEIRVPDF